MSETKRRRTAFTLIELLVVLAIIGVLVGLLLPAVQSVREAARRSSCCNNLMQIGIALNNYEAAYGVLPPGVVNSTGPIQNMAVGYHLSWAVQVLPFLEQKAAFNRLNFLVGAYDDPNATVRSVQIGVYLCPSDNTASSASPTSYAGCHHGVETPIAADNKGVFFLNSRVRYEDVVDGTSHTVYVGEKRHGNDLGWMSGTRATLRNTGTPINGVTLPTPTNPDPVGGYGSFHAGGANTLFGDGSIRFLRAAIAPQVLEHLGIRNDGEIISHDDY